MYIRPAIESESTLLGALILDSKLFPEIKDKLCAPDFYTDRHQKLFDVMGVLFERHGCFDASMILEHIDYEDAEDMSHVYELANNCCSTANIKAHADIIREKSVSRKLLECAREVKAEQIKTMSQEDMLVSYLEETAAEIKSATVDAHYLKIIMFEVNQVFVGVIKALENEQEPFNAPTLADLHQHE